jgi:hypothetical protein
MTMESRVLGRKQVSIGQADRLCGILSIVDRCQVSANRDEAAVELFE